ncbi:MAG: phytanoyl-CoA dioxygenase family protein [Bacteroidia bacterium]
MKRLLEDFDRNGFVILENVLDESFCERAVYEMERAIEKEVEYQGTKNYPYYGYVLCNAVYGGVFLDIFENEDLWAIVNSIMGENSILYSYTSSSMPPRSGNSASKIHIDTNIVQEKIFRLGIFIPINEHTSKNGGLTFLPGSHKLKARPTEEEYLTNCVRFDSKGGDVLLFNAQLWHSGGMNRTDQWRHAITMNVGQPWMKQRVDMPKMMMKQKINLNTLSEEARVKLGFYSQVPTSYDEYFDTAITRKFL